GSAVEYRVTAAIILVTLLAPAIVVIWRWARQRSLPPAPDEARFSAWTAVAAEDRLATAAAPRQAGVFTARSRRLALAAAAAGAVAAVGFPPKPALGPQFTATRDAVIVTSDSVLMAHGGNPADWKRLTSVGRDTLGPWQRFLRKHELTPEAQTFASGYVPPTWWTVRYVRTTGTAAERAEEWRVRLWPDGRPLDARHILPDSAPRPAADTATLRRLALGSLAQEGIDTSTLRESEFRETARPARKDARVTYTDTAVKLPEGAAARAWVDFAGDEPLVTRRGVELPESFVRADRARQSNRLLVGGATILLLLGFAVAGGIIVKRRRPIVVNDGRLDRRSTWLAVGALVVLGMLANLNTLPSQLFSYDTTEPWSRFVGTTVLAFVVTIPLALAAIGLWFVLDAMRRRAGIPMLAGEPSRSASRDTLIAGLGLAGIVYVTIPLNALAWRGGLPRTPTTVLNDVAPPLSGIADVPMSALMLVTLIGIPILIVAGLSDRRRTRAIIAAAVALLVAVAAWSIGSPELDFLRVGLIVASVAVVSAAVVAWGALSVWSWLIAGLAIQALNGLRGAAYGVVWQQRVAGVLTVLVAAGLIALIARRTARKPLSIPTSKVG
ncbi:MAG TPA: hypothetical protein VNO75_02955, partial [Gemmatimonadaceae bacterium]|nr:hypothetical protein [Gemmatimonadaceae bacterium]